MIKRVLMVAGLVTGLGGAGWVAAQPGTGPAARDRAPLSGRQANARGPMGGGLGGMPMMMGVDGMCGMGMMGGADTKVEVKNVDKGVTMTITSNDPATVTRIQKMAEAHRLMREALTP